MSPLPFASFFLLSQTLQRRHDFTRRSLGTKILKEPVELLSRHLRAARGVHRAIFRFDGRDISEYGRHVHRAFLFFSFGCTEHYSRRSFLFRAIPLTWWKGNLEDTAVRCLSGSLTWTKSIGRLSFIHSRRNHTGCRVLCQLL